MITKKKSSHYTLLYEMERSGRNLNRVSLLFLCKRKLVTYHTCFLNMYSFSYGARKRNKSSFLKYGDSLYKQIEFSMRFILQIYFLMLCKPSSAMP